VAIRKRRSRRANSSQPSVEIHESTRAARARSPAWTSVVVSQGCRCDRGELVGQVDQQRAAVVAKRAGAGDPKEAGRALQKRDRVSTQQASQVPIVARAIAGRCEALQHNIVKPCPRLAPGVFQRAFKPLKRVGSVRRQSA
jgi:hypothetical protein